LPSGRVLYYPEARIKTGWRYDKPVDNIRWRYGYLWGGHLTENVDQAIARDILAEALLACESQGVHIALHVHDELVSVCDGWNAKRDLQTMHSCMVHVPDWAEGLPLDSEGGLSPYYMK
jgi:DNA polymerase